MTNYRSNRDRFLEYNKNRLNDIFEVDLKNQSRVIDKQTNTRINNRLKTDNLITKWYQHIDTMYDLLLHSVECFGDLPFLGTRKFPENEYKWETYQTIFDRSKNLGAGLNKLCGLQLEYKADDTTHSMAVA